jgi:starch synthase
MKPITGSALPPVSAVCASGFVGTHPLDADSWSGSSRFFFGEIKARGSLHSCFGGEIPKLKKTMLALSNLRPLPSSKKLMIERMYMSVVYRNTLSAHLARKMTTSTFPVGSVSIQLGSMFNLNDHIPAHVVRTSYNDGNLVQAINSPFYATSSFSAKMIDASIRYEQEVSLGLDAIFTMSEFLRQSFIHDYGVPERKVICIGAGINMPPDLADDLLTQDLTLKNYDQPKILFIAKEFLRKGGETVLQAFKQIRTAIPNAEIYFVGEVPRDLHSMSPAKGVHFEGFLRKDNPHDLQRLRALFSKSSLFVLPAFHEAFGISPLEAMLNGIPCVVSNEWALKEIVPAGKVGENVKPGNAKELAEICISLLRNPDKLRTYGHAARNWVAERFLWSKVVDRLASHLSGDAIARQTGQDRAVTLNAPS